MLIDDFYTINQQNIGAAEATFTLRINVAHPVFAGHFPDNPIVPGAILLQICCNLLSQTLNKKMVLTEAKNIKYLNIILPNQNPEISYIIQWENFDNQYNVKCSIVNQETQFAKMSLTMQVQNN